MTIPGEFVLPDISIIIPFILILSSNGDYLKNKSTSFHISEHFISVTLLVIYVVFPQTVILGELERTVMYFVGIQITEKIASFLVIVVRITAILLMDVKVSV